MWLKRRQYNQYEKLKQTLVTRRLTSLISACNFLKVDHYGGGHSIFRITSKLVFTREGDKRGQCSVSNYAPER